MQKTLTNSEIRFWLSKEQHDGPLEEFSQVLRLAPRNTESHRPRPRLNKPEESSIFIKYFHQKSNIKTVRKIMNKDDCF
jgi:hypothetical protein